MASTHLTGNDLVEHGPALIATGFVFTILSGAAIALRFFSKYVIKLSIGADDWWILGAYAFFLPEQIFQLVALYNAFWPATPDVKGYVKNMYMSPFFYYVTNTFIRISILCYYRRIFNVARFRKATTILIVICVLWCIPGTLVQILNCQPMASVWNTSIKGHCVNYMLFYIIVMSIETALDAIVLAMPLREIYFLQMTFRKKVLISLIFLLGGFVMITNVIRIVWTYTSSPTKLNIGVDVLFYNIHDGTAFICACLPTYTPLFAKAKDIGSRVWSTMTSRLYSTGSGTDSQDSYNLSDVKTLENRRSYYRQIKPQLSDKHINVRENDGELGVAGLT
ncbi:hypothetical protein B7494_g4219 [Chlorociboria aeruginascens]|nr:hypothetical protein B7494_g4219 [Chlorociboria aeruginascens]